MRGSARKTRRSSKTDRPWSGRAPSTGFAREDWRLRDTLPHLVFGEPAIQQTAPWQIAAYACLLAVAVVAGVFALARKERLRKAALYSWVWFLLAMALLFGLSLRFPIYQEKHYLVLTVPLALLMGLGTASLHKVARIAAFLCFVALALPSLHNVYFRHQLADHPVEDCFSFPHARAASRELPASSGRHLRTRRSYPRDLATGLRNSCETMNVTPAVHGKRWSTGASASARWRSWAATT